MSGLKLLSFGTCVMLLAFGVHNVSAGNYGLATWDFGWAVINLYVGITVKGI